MKTLNSMLLAGLLCFGFVDSADAQRNDPASLVAPQDKALVVFARPRGLGKAVNFYVYDENKKLRTLFKGKEFASIEVEPGKHTFYVVSENARLVRADLAAARTYIVLADVAMGGGKARVKSLEPALRGSPSFTESTEWISSCKPGAPDFKKGEKWTSKRQSALEKRMVVAEEEWSAMDEKERDALTLRPDDGRTAEEATKLQSR